MTAAKKSPTIYDVAKLSDVSISTISRVLNAPEKVNPGTHKRVMEAIDRLGFVPKAEARARALQQTGRIGVITPFFTAPSFVQRLRGVASVLSKTNYELVIYTVDSMEHLHGYISSIPLTGNLDGIIIMSLSIGEENVQRFINGGLETVLIEYFHPKLNSIEIDDLQGGRLAAQHLIQKGHRRIAFLGDVKTPEKYAIHPASARLRGFKEALQEAGLSLCEEYVRLCSNTQEGSRQAARELLNLPTPPTAIFAAADIQALGIMKVARQVDLGIPDQLAVIGFDDIDIAEHVDLTTIRQHLDDSGRLAAEMVLSGLEDSKRPLQHIHLPLQVVERATT